jgi:hypothetical protein
MHSPWFGFLAFLAICIGMFVVKENSTLGAIFLGTGLVIQVLRTLFH